MFSDHQSASALVFHAAGRWVYTSGLRLRVAAPANRPVALSMSGPRFDPIEIKRQLAFVDLATHEGLEVRRSGPSLHVAVCPFHQEKSGSFTIYSYSDHSLDHAHCFGCGWKDGKAGDIFDFWRERHGGDFVSALAPLASLASVSPSVFERKRSTAAQVPRMTESSKTEKGKPALPRMRKLNEADIVTLAALRNLSIEGVRAASDVGRVGFCVWPQWEDRNGCWRVADDAAGSWVVTDHARRVAQFRLLNGAKFRIGGKRRTPNAERPISNEEEREIKAWTKGSPTWAIGAAEIDSITSTKRGSVILVEGGADMLAAFHFLWLFQRLTSVAVVAMLGASCGICDEALPFFARKRVRLIMHNDPAGVEASARWTHQLTAAGAAVESFSLGDLTKRDGAFVSDLNDLALCDESVWLDPELKAAFLDFDF